MNNINKRINIVKKIIIDYFYENNIYKSACLAQSYLLYKYILELNENCKLIKGYIINHTEQVYYSHFWIEYNDIIYDISTETYLQDYELIYHDDIKTKRRILSKNISDEILIKYKNIDNIYFDKIRDESYLMCIENKFLEDVEKKASFEIFNKIKEIHNKIIH
jgi:hypothetical protein